MTIAFDGVVLPSVKTTKAEGLIHGLGMTRLLVLACLTMAFGPTKPAYASVNNLEAQKQEDAGSKAATTCLNSAALPPSVRRAMLTVLRQHPTETRWSGRTGGEMFGVAAKQLPTGSIRPRAVPATLELTRKLAVHEVLSGKSLLDRYATAGLTDATTLKQAVLEVAGKLSVNGRGSAMLQGGAIEGDYAVAYVIANERTLIAQLFEKTELEAVRAAYRDVMQEQANRLIERSNWRDALLLWNHLHKQKLVTPELYLDAAKCFKELDHKDDVVRILTEAIEVYGSQGTAEFLERAGDIALSVQCESAQVLAKKAFELASQRLTKMRTLPEARTSARKTPD